jgi:hypothetical protein
VWSLGNRAYLPSVNLKTYRFAGESGLASRFTPHIPACARKPAKRFDATMNERRPAREIASYWQDGIFRFSARRCSFIPRMNAIQRDNLRMIGVVIKC